VLRQPWRLLTQESLVDFSVKLHEVVSAGEPLNPEVIERVREAWGLTIRDSYGQTETTAMVGNSPGHRVKPGSMGRPLPGYSIALLDEDRNAADEDEICVDLSMRPLGLTPGHGEDGVSLLNGGDRCYYHTGDVAAGDADGYITFVGRKDDRFKASDYRLSPFELESALIEHPALAEAAVVPSPDPLRFAVQGLYHPELWLRAGRACSA